MSIIVHGSQGSGKPLYAPLLMQHFKLANVWDDGELREDLQRMPGPKPPAIEPWYVYEWVERHPDEFKGGRTLFLTSDEPPQHMARWRRVVHIFDAVNAAVESGVRVHVRAMASDPQQAFTAQAVLEAIGVPAQCMNRYVLARAHTTLCALGWRRERTRNPFTHSLGWQYVSPAVQEA
jgi:hypothetical protein